jgi:gliding motility-associated-like protein
MTAVSLPGHDLLWYANPTGGTPTDPPTISTHAVDTFEYYVSQKELFGCESFRTKQTAVVRPTPSALFTVNDLIQCEMGNEFSFINSSNNLSNPKFIWDFGDGSMDSSGAANIKHSYKNYGYFTVKLLALNQPACTNEKIATVRVMPKPIPAFDAPSVICDKDLGVALTDRSSVPSGLGVINKWSWEVDGTHYSTQQMPQIAVRHGGSLPISLSVTTSDGCTSDTLKKSLPVRHKPVAAFDYKNALCENEIIKFNDLSHIPSGMNDEYITKWTWIFDGTSSSMSQRPALYFGSGQHRARLVVTTNYGCLSDVEEKDLIVNPKPSVALSINDSCVEKDIFYSARDLLNNIRSWYWDFGNGLMKEGNVVTKKFAREGNQPFILISETDKGCKDTINRAFTIYDNDSYAGSDTVVARNQPVFLNARGGNDVTYKWSPSAGLNNPNIEKPVATLDRDMEYTLYSITNKGCEHTSNIFIKRYVGAEIYIPNAFTPNGDGKNDVLKVIPIGYKSFDFLAIYNRYGQQVYLTRDFHKGWDGTIGGVPQDAGNYVVATKMTDYNGNVMVRKGNVMLLR